MWKAWKLLIFVFLIVTSCDGSLLAQTTADAIRVLAAEGDFVAQTKQGIQPLSHWKLWRLGDGGYEVVDQKLKNASSVETFQFDAQLMPTGFTKTVGGVSQTKGGLPSHGTSTTISCQYKPRELTCTESYEGKKSSISITAEPPYVFTGEFYDLNFAWFMTGVVNLATRDENKDGLVNVYFLSDGEKPDEIALEADKPMKIIPAGQEDGQFDGKQQVLKKFEADLGSFSILRTNAKSMVISLGQRENSTIALAIINYKEYVSWQPK